MNKKLLFLLIMLFICLFGCSESIHNFGDEKDIPGDVTEKDEKGEASGIEEDSKKGEASGADIKDIPDDVVPDGRDKGETFGTYGEVTGVPRGGKGEYGTDPTGTDPDKEGKPKDPGLIIKPPKQPVIKPGQLTAEAYNDNEHFLYWQGLLTSDQSGDGLFKQYYEKFAFKNLYRIKISVPVTVPAEIDLLDENGEPLSTVHTDAQGNCYLYPQTEAEEYKIRIKYRKKGEIVSEIETITGDRSFDLDGDDPRINKIQLLFVIDATGSMCDEIKYIQAEVADTINKVQGMNKDTEIELGIIMYRDKGDEYVVRPSPFTTDIKAQQEFLAKQNAAGGGDFPEAVQDAMSEAVKMQWTPNVKTKILIHMADAPSHDKDVPEWKKATDDLAREGVHVITVASSGIDKKTEYFFRCQSLITNGTYVYLTDDSGIGGSHLPGTVEEKPITEFLNLCLIRLIDGYHTGEFSDPVSYLANRPQEQKITD